MMATWFYAESVDDQPLGPFSTSEFHQLIRERKITPETLVSSDGDSEWIPASAVGGLFPGTPIPGTPSLPAPRKKASKALSGLPAPAKSSTAGSGQKSPFSNPAVIASLAVPTLLLLMFAAWQLGRSGAQAAVRANRNVGHSAENVAMESSIKASQATRNEEAKLSKEVEDLKKQHRALNEEIQTLEDKKSNLDRKAKELEGKVHELTTMLEKRNRWSEPQFVFVNPEHFAVGVDLRPNGSVIFNQRAEDLAAQLAIRKVRESRIPRVACDKVLTRRLYEAFKEGEPVPPGLHEEVKKVIGPRQFLPVKQNAAQSLMFVTFKNATKNEQVLGVLKEIRKDGLVYTNFSKQDLDIAKSDLRPGSARVAQGEEIISTLKAGDFLDYCLYNVAHKLASSNYVSIAVRVGLDEIEQQPGSGSGRASAFGPPGSPRIPIQTNDPLTMATGVILQEFLAHIYEVPNPHKSVEKAVQYIEDEVYSKLVKLGVRVVESEQLEKLRQVTATRPALINQANILNLTHVLLIEVKSPLRKGVYHLSVRLVDAITDEVVSADSGDRVRGFEESEHVFHLGSGKIAMIESDNEKAPTNYTGTEQPAVVPILKRPSAKLSRNLVYLEDETSSPMKYRNLFDLQLQELPRQDKDKKDIVKSLIKIAKSSEVPRELMMRYVVCRLARSCQQLAGRVTEIQGPDKEGLNRTVKISLAAADGLKPGDVLEVMRIRNLSGGEREQLILATQLTVIQVFDDHSLARIVPTGLEKDWPEVGELTTNDIVLPAIQQRRSVAFAAPNWSMPNKKSEIAMVMSNPVTAARIKATGLQTAELLNTTLSKSFTQLGIPSKMEGAIAVPQQQRFGRNIGFGFRDSASPLTQAQVLDRVRNLDATHGVIWDIQPLDTNKYKITIGIYPFSAANKGAPEPLDVFDFEIVDSNLN
jgi:cell division protein FtsB